MSVASVRHRGLLLSLVLATSLFAGACGGGEESTEEPPGQDSSTVAEAGDDATSDEGIDTTGGDSIADADAEAGCGDGSSACGTSCVDLTTDPKNCGACGKDCTALPGVDATKVTCVAGACVPKDACAPNRAHCSTNPDDGCEVDTTTTTDCGACGVACAEPTPLCSADTDGVYKCANDCGGTTPTRCAMSCVDTATNTAHCGACDNACPVPPNATAKCTAGACGFECLPNFGDCDGVASNGCEVDLTSTPEHCGACTTACTVANGTAGCVASACTVASCNTGFADCDTLATNGCEINTTSNADHCGTCTNKCAFANATAVCSSSACAVGACNPGFADCNTTSSDGCEVNTQTDSNNCGACGTICNLANATSNCAAGACAIATCSPGFADCNGTPGDGCETSVLLDPLNCGACGNGCAVPNATAACAAGLCAVGACNAGFADCNGSVPDGCEKNTASDVNNCGACGNVCSLPHATANCSAGACAIASCDAGWADCNGNASDGCEVNTANDPLNCGGCGTTCAISNGTTSCSAGTCAIAACNAGFRDCNGVYADGCEVNLTNDTNNCGGCGTKCSAVCVGNVGATTCSGGNCGIAACTGSSHNLDGLCSNGCECLASPSNTCATPISVGALPLGASTSVSRNLVPVDAVAWYAVTFTGNTSAAYHPRVRLAANPGGRFRFDVVTNCSGTALGCSAEGGVSAGKTDWEMFSTAPLPGYTNPIPAVGGGGTVLVKVYRVSGQPVTCDNFTLTFSN